MTDPFATVRKGASLIALAIGAPALAQPALYGRLNAALERVEGGDSPAGAGTGRLSNYRSVIGLRGEERLDGSMKVIWQVESGLALDTGEGEIASRDTRVGLEGPFGSLFAGVWTLPYTSATSKLDPFYPTTAGYMALMGNGSAPNADHLSDTSAFDRRQRNQLQYWSPTWAGWTLRTAYGFGEERVESTGAHPSLWSGSLAYEAGSWSLVAAHERHREYQGPSLTDTAWKLAAAWSAAGTRLGLVVERLRYETPLGPLKRNAWYASAVVPLGPGSLLAGYGRADDGASRVPQAVGNVRSGPRTGARQLSVGYELALSQRTVLYGYASRIHNQAAARYDFAINALGVSDGADPRVIALGLRHSF